MSCPLLARVHAYSPEKLIKMAFEKLPFKTLQSVFTTTCPSQRRILKNLSKRRPNMRLHRRLADTLYYYQGANLSCLGRWNQMITLQMQHELQKRGQLEEGKENTLTEWKLRVRLAGIMTAEKRAMEQTRRERAEAVTKSWKKEAKAYDRAGSDEPEVTMEEVRAERLR